jgi:hypothetical protein
MDVRTTTWMPSCAATIARVASIPSTFGIERSIRTTSGLVPAASSIASAPSDAPPTTSMSSAVARSLSRPARTRP